MAQPVPNRDLGDEAVAAKPVWRPSDVARCSHDATYTLRDYDILRTYCLSCGARVRAEAQR